jgi:PASTA domain
LWFPRVVVPLREPVGGRRVRGGPRAAAGWWRESVPRVVGLDRRDALALLRSEGLAARTVGRVRRGRVVRQRPRPGTEIRER